MRTRPVYRAPCQALCVVLVGCSANGGMTFSVKKYKDLLLVQYGSLCATLPLVGYGR